METQKNLVCNIPFEISEFMQIFGIQNYIDVSLLHKNSSSSSKWEWIILFFFTNL